MTNSIHTTIQHRVNSEQGECASRAGQSKQKHTRKKTIQEKLEWIENSKVCTNCRVRKHKDEYYKNRHQCKECVLHIEKMQRDKQRLDELEANNGSRFVLQKPGEFMDDYQKQATYNMLTLLGWSYNKEKNIYYKLPIKDENGVWAFNKPTKPSIKQLKDKYNGFRRKVTVDTLPKFKYKYNGSKRVSEDLINQIIKEHIIDKQTVKSLSEKYGMNDHKITSWIVSIMNEGLRK